VLLPTYYGFLARTGFDNLTGFDGKTLQPSFTSTDKLGDINFAGFFTYGSDAPPGQDREVFHSAKDGAVVGSNTGTGVGFGAPTYRDGFIVATGNNFPYKYGYFDFRDNRLKTPAPSGGFMWDHILAT
jgi:hypothetical protein